MSRQSEHDRASAAWDDYEAQRARNDSDRRAANPGIILPPRHGRAKSPVEGLGDFVRSERAAQSTAPRDAAKTRAAKQMRLKDQAKRAYAQNLRPYVKPLDGSRYFPHQGVQECLRRARQGLTPVATDLAAQ